MTDKELTELIYAIASPILSIADIESAIAFLLKSHILKMKTGDGNGLEAKTTWVTVIFGLTHWVTEETN